MCGISGIISKNNSDNLGILIEQMNNLIAHRGPDAEGYFIDEKIALGHRRLSILDLRPSGNQPMFFKNLVIVFNGEIYNYLELRNELILLGYNFATDTDTEVILAAYDYWGQDCVKRFNGMWSFAIYDKNRKIVFCSRDRFGVKPFYYASIDNKFVFGSEIKQLLIFFNNNIADKQILIEFLICGFSEHTEKTFFKYIFNLRGGHNLIYDLVKNKYEIKRYYDIKIKEINNNEIKSISSYYNNLIRSITYRLRSDVKVGSCLSGGLDSSSIASIASKIYNKNSGEQFIGIHAKSTESNSDESYYAEIVAKDKNINLVKIVPTLQDFANSIDEVVYTQEEPFSGPSVFMQYFVMKKAKEFGCKVMLDGQGGDETLLGYERYYPTYLFSSDIITSFKNLFWAYYNSKLSFMQLLSYCFYFLCFPLRIARLKYKYSFIKSEYMPNFKWIKKNAKAYTVLTDLQKLELFSTQLPHLLRYEDKNSMRHSIETRLPLLDYELVETALSIDNEFKLKNGWSKYILRKSMENLMPNEIVWRKNKFGFEAPQNTWLESIRNTMIDTISKNHIIAIISKKNIDFSSISNDILWQLFSIAKWSDVFNINDIA